MESCTYICPQIILYRLKKNPGYALFIRQLLVAFGKTLVHEVDFIL